MIKEVRLNDKIWFGKYKGHTIKEILSIDRHYLDDLMFKNKIVYSENIIKYLEQKNSKFKSPKLHWIDTSATFTVGATITSA